MADDAAYTLLASNGCGSVIVEADLRVAAVWARTYGWAGRCARRH